MKEIYVLIEGCYDDSYTFAVDGFYTSQEAAYKKAYEENIEAIKSLTKGELKELYEWYQVFSSEELAARCAQLHFPPYGMYSVRELKEIKDA